MSRIRFGRVAAFGLAIALTSAAATQVRADGKTFNAIQSAISRSARIPLGTVPVTVQPRGSTKRVAALTGATYVQLMQALHGTARTVRAVSAATGLQRTSTITQVGSAPAGYGTIFQWDRSQQSALLLVFVNPADPTGVAIEGLQQGDTIQICAATGLCSFSKDTGNPLAASIVTLVADGAADVVALLSPSGGSGSAAGTTGTGTTGTKSGSGANAAVSAIEQTGKDAAALFQGTGAPEKFRDPFGVDPGSHGNALEEGGVVVCMPQGNGIYYSADPNHKSFWASNPPSVGQPRGLPAFYRSLASQVPFFFIGQNARNKNTAVCQSNGSAYILAWDYAYADNSGFYEVWVQLTQASSSTAAPAAPAVARKARATR